MDLNRRQFVALSLLAGSLALPLAACSKNSQLDDAKSEYDPNYTIAVIFSTNEIRSTYIQFYDADLKLVNRVFYPYADLNLGGPASIPIYEDEIYLIAGGLMWQQDDRKVISLNLSTGVVREYHVDQIAISCIAVSSEYFYTTNNLNGTGHVGQIKKSSGEATYIDLGVSCGSIVSFADRFCVSWMTLTETGDNKYLSIYSHNLELIDVVDLTSVGITGFTQTTETDNGRFCFVSQDNEPGYYNIYSFDAYSSAANLLCKLNYSIIDTTLNDGYLYISGYGYDDSGLAKFIKVYDSSSGTLLNSQPCDYYPGKIIFEDNLCYVDGADALIKYQTDGVNFTELERAPFTGISVGTTTLTAGEMFIKS